jgi:hypothetical protein
MLPWFNDLLSTHLFFSFFFSWQVLPLLLSFIFFMAVIPGLYISHKLSQQTLSKYRQTYTGRKKQQFIWLLVTIQFIFSIGLVYATTLTQKQMNLIKSRAYHYENTIEIGKWHPSSVSALSGTETNGWDRVYKSFHEFCTLLLAS